MLATPAVRRTLGAPSAAGRRARTRATAAAGTATTAATRTTGPLSQKIPTTAPGSASARTGPGTGARMPRASRAAVAPAARTRDPAAIASVVLACDARKGAFASCLLYTSDAADDL